MSRDSKRRSNPARGPGKPRPAAAGSVPLDPRTAGDPAPWLRTTAGGVAALTAAVLAWIAFAHHPVGDYFTESDFYGYVQGARLIQHGRIDFSRYSVIGPLYELLLAGLSLVVRDEFRAGQLISIASAAGVLLLWARIARRRAGEATALWTTLFIAANPVFLRYGVSATTDMLAVFMESAAACAILAAAGPRAPLAAGLLVALAALTRYSALVLVPAALACLMIWPGPGGPVAGRVGSSRLRALGWFAAGFAVLALPWLGASLHAGHLPGANLIQSFSFYSDPSATRNIQDAAPNSAANPYRSLGELLREQPGALLARLVANVPDHLRRNLESLVGVAVAWVCGIGLLFALLDGAWRRLLPVALTGTLLFASLVPVFYSDRYALPLVPFYLLLAGLAVGSPRLALRVRPPGLSLKWAAALVPLALSVQSAAIQQRWIASQLPLEVIAAGDALRRVAPPGSGVLSRKMHVAHYSRTNAVAFPRVSSLAELSDDCRRNGAQFIYYSWYEAELRPEFWYLLDTTAVVPGLTRIPFPAKNPALLFRIGPGFGHDPDWLADGAQRQLHEARAQVQVLTERDAWSAYLTLGEDARARGDHAAALEHFLAVTRGHPALALGWQRAADELLAAGRLDDARAAYEHARRLAPGDVATLIGIGWTQARSGRADLAAQTWAPLVGDVRDATTLNAMAAVFERAEDLASLKATRKALAALPKR